MKDVFGDGFGNSLLQGIDEIQLPAAVGWWPQTLGWQLLALAAALYLGYRLYRGAQRWWFNRYRRSALAQLTQLEQRADGDYHDVLSALPALLKATALHAYPRHEIAALSGVHWLAFLDQHYSGPSFRQGVGRQLLNIAYQPDCRWQLSPQEARHLIHMCRRWLGKHRVAKPGAP
jgi:hypothetical protein